MKMFALYAALAVVALALTPALISILAPRVRGRKLLVKALRRNGVDTTVFPAKFLEECVSEAYDFAKAAAKNSDKPWKRIYNDVLMRDVIIIKAILKDPSSADMNPAMRDRLIRFGIIY